MEPTKPRKRGPTKQYNRPISMHEDDQGKDLLEQLCQKMGLGQAAVLRYLIRKEAQAQGIQPG